MKKVLKYITVICFFFVLSGFVNGNTMGNLEKGRIIEGVVCMLDARQSYALYLPIDYNPDKKWPILYTFDPGARSRIPLKLFQVAAEKYGFIIACSNNLKNGPWQPILEAMKSMWADTKLRFSLDLNRIYTAGFSGGARAAAAFSDVVGVKVEGIIACGAGLPSMITPEKVKPSFYHGIVGLEDFNYKELVKLEGELARAGVEHFIEVIDGGHTWPPEEVCSRSIEGMEILAMKKGLREKDAGLIETGYHHWLERAKDLEEAGHLYHSIHYYLQLARLFNGLKDIIGIQKKIRSLESSKKFKKFSLEENMRNIEEWEYIKKFAGEFNLIKNQNSKRLDIKKICIDLEIGFLRREAEKNKDIYRSAMAKRLLQELELKGNSDGIDYLNKDDTNRAVIFFEIAAQTNQQGFRAFYNLACLYARLGVKEKALKNLKIAVENLQNTGYKDFTFLNKEKDLDPIRNEKEFLEMLQKLGMQSGDSK